MRVSFLLLHLSILHWAGLWGGCALAAWVCLRVSTRTEGADTCSAGGVWALVVALIVPIVLALTLVRAHAVTAAGLGNTWGQLRWSLYVGSTLAGWALWHSHALTGRAQRGVGEFAAWTTLSGGCWVLGGVVPGIWGSFLVLELSLTFLLLLLASAQLMAPAAGGAVGSGFRRYQHVSLEQALTWACLLLLWASAFALLLLIWAWALLVAQGLVAFEGEHAAFLAEGWGWRHSFGQVTAQVALGLALLTKLLLVPTQFTLTQLYGRLAPRAFAVYLATYYMYFLPLGAAVLLSTLPTLVPAFALLVGLGAVLAALVGAAEVRPVRDLRGVVAFSTLFTLLLLVMVGALVSALDVANFDNVSCCVTFLFRWVPLFGGGTHVPGLPARWCRSLSPATHARGCRYPRTTGYAWGARAALGWACRPAALLFFFCKAGAGVSPGLVWPPRRSCRAGACGGGGVVRVPSGQRFAGEAGL